MLLCERVLLQTDKKGLGGLSVNLNGGTGDEEPLVDAAINWGGGKLFVGWDGAVGLASIDMISGLIVRHVCPGSI